MQYKSFKELKQYTSLECDETFSEIISKLERVKNLITPLDISADNPLPISCGVIKINHLLGEMSAKFLFYFDYTPETQTFLIQVYCYYPSHYTFKPMLTYTLQLSDNKHICKLIDSKDSILDAQSLYEFERFFDLFLIYFNVPKKTQSNFVFSRCGSSRCVTIPAMFNDSIWYTVKCANHKDINDTAEFVLKSMSGYTLGYERKSKNSSQLIPPYKKSVKKTEAS